MPKHFVQGRDVYIKCRVPPWLLSTSQDHVSEVNTCEELFKVNVCKIITYSTLKNFPIYCKFKNFGRSFQGTEAYVVKIEGYNVDVKLWPPNLSEIRRHFTPKQEILDSVDTFLRNTTSTLHRSDDDRDEFNFISRH